MGLLRTARTTWRDFAGMTRLLNLPRAQRRVLVYAEDSFSYIQFEGTLRALMDDYGHRVVYITSDPDDPLFRAHPERMDVVFMRRFVPGYFPKIDSDVLLLTMPDLDQFHIKKPRTATRCVYLFHSLNSIHMVYRPGAFDHYDAFFCAGEHHHRELTRHFAAKGGPPPALHMVGYHKLDRVAAAHGAYRKRHPERTTVLLAPSWGRANAIEAHGETIVAGLLAAGYRVVVRPHPCFFLPIYPEGQAAVRRLEAQFAGGDDFVLERTIDTEDAFHEADLMISDWSGAAYEYALGTLRPVLFVDVPRKVFNPDWEALGCTPFEDEMRAECGALIPPAEVDSIARHAADLLARGGEYRERLSRLRDARIYNVGHAGAAGARVIHDLLDRCAPPSHD